MLKYAALLFNTVALLIYQFFFADGITVTSNIPSSAKPGTEFTVELTINKGSVGGFAKLQQDLPEGFTAVQDENASASFTFSNQSVKFIWMALPGDKEFKVRYKVKVAEGISGTKSIAGKFSYVSDNVKQSVEIATANIEVGDAAGNNAMASTTPSTTESTTTETTTPSNTSTPTNTETLATTNTPVNTTPVETANNTNTSTPETTTTNTASNETAATTPETKTPETSTTSATSGTEEPSSIVCKRNAPSSVTGDFVVEITVNKGNVTGFAKLLETLPAGFTATAIESQGASFSFTDQKVKYVWVSMPTQPEFKISYKVSIASGTTGNLPIDGVFSYIENDETKKFVIPTSLIVFGDHPVMNAVANNNTSNTTTTSENPTTTTNNTSGDNSVATTNNNTTNNTTTQSTNNTTQSNTSANLSATTIPTAQGNIKYKVQIAALHNAVDAQVLANRYNINQPVETEMAEGFTKYVVGSHTEYKSARDARETIKNKGVTGPFVTAYNNGKRVTVQEALMVSNQQWFR